MHTCLLHTYGKAQARLTPAPDVQGRREKRWLVILPDLSCLATYIGYVSSVYAKVVSTSLHYEC